MRQHMHIRCDAYWLQKAGYAQDEYEDAFAPARARDRCGEFRCAVADGATETSFSGLWARLLVEAYVTGELADMSRDSLAPLAAAWRDHIDARTRDKPLPWYAQEKLEQGAFSSLIGITLHADGAWQALCVGDSCLFHVRPRQAIRAFPYHTPEQFGSRPLLISTSAAVNTSVQAQVIRGHWQDGDFFLLMTDALAHFFLSQRHLRSQLVAARDQHAFEQIVAHARDERLCRNDDVTLLKVAPKVGDNRRGMG